MDKIGRALAAFARGRRFAILTEASNADFNLRGFDRACFTMAPVVARLAQCAAGSSDRSAVAGRRSNLGDVHGPLLHPARPGRG